MYLSACFSLLEVMRMEASIIMDVCVYIYASLFVLIYRWL